MLGLNSCTSDSQCYCRRVSHYLLENGGDGQMTPLLRLGSGACAGIIGMTATYPLDMVRGRLTVQAGKEYTGILHATRMIIKQVHRPIIACCHIAERLDAH